MSPVDDFLALHRFADAKATAERALANGFDTVATHVALFTVAFVLQDQRSMDEQIAWAAGKPHETRLALRRMGSAGFEGRFHVVRALADTSARFLVADNLTSAASGVKTYVALLEAASNDPHEAKNVALAAIRSDQGSNTLRDAALVFAFAGDERLALATRDQWKKRLSEGPFKESALFDEAIEALVFISRGELSTALTYSAQAPLTGLAGYLPVYVRGLALLAAKDGRTAVTEFQRIIDHRGIDPISIFYPLAHVQQARAYAEFGDIASSRKAYEAFFELWKGADPDVPVLLEARREYSYLR
jgi:hypothetical protein